MLGILICYASFHSFESLQRANIQRFVKCPHRIYILKTTVSADPSTGHQINLNTLLANAWEECDSFLLFDNDMLFLDEFQEPTEECWYWSQERNGFEYAWPNLLYFKKHDLMNRIWFENDSDSGGSTWKYLQEAQTKRKITLDKEGMEDYQEQLETLGKKYGIGNWSERYWLNGCPIFHFRAMSNWTKYPIDYLTKKEMLIQSYSLKYC